MSIDPVSLAVTAALTAGSMAMQMSRKIEGPRLDDLNVTVADYGTKLPYFYGLRRLEGCPIFWAEPIREVKKKRKTKGGKYNEYTYYGTWAVAIADHEIDAVSRVWFDKHLIYDTTGAGPISPVAITSSRTTKSGRSRQTSINLPDHMRIYLGTETQEADPRMLATVETAEGVGSCPAYRGVSYIVFEDVPLEKFGNRMPQITIEAVSSASPVYPYEKIVVPITQPFRLWGFTFSPDYSRFIWGIEEEFCMVDTASRAIMISGTLPSDVVNVAEVKGISNNGTIYAIDGGRNVLKSFTPDGVSYNGSLGALATDQDFCIVRQDGNGNEHLFTIAYSVLRTFYSMNLYGIGTLSERVPLDETGVDFKVANVFTDSYGDIWGVGGFPSGTTLYLWRLVDTGVRPGSDGFFSVAGVANVGTIPELAGVHYKDADVDHFVVEINHNTLVTIDIDTGTLTGTVSMPSLDVYNTYKQFVNCPPGANSIWLDEQEISLADLSVIRTITTTSWSTEQSDGIIYDPVNHALITAPGVIYDPTIMWRYLDRVSSDGVTLATVANDVSLRCGLDSGNYDFSALTQTIRGYSWTQGPGKDILEPLFDAHDCDIRPHDFTLQGKLRSGTSLGTLSVANYVRDGDTRYAVEILQDSDLPRSLTFSFADVDADQQTNSVLVQRPLDAIDSVRELTIDMTTMAENVDTARQMAERYFRRAWFSRYSYKQGLTRQNLALEPADVYTLALDDVSHKARCTKTIIASDGVIRTEWTRDDAAVGALSGAAGADMDGRVPAVIPIPGLTKGIVMDAPLAVDAHDSTTPFAYYAAAPYGTDTFWMGADFNVSDDGSADSYDPSWAAVASQDAMTWGYADGALADALSTVIDYGHTLTVNMQHGTLASSTEDAILGNGATNLIAVQSGSGWEYIQFITATLTATDTYALTGLLRGCRGTEQYTATHAAGDAVVVMGPASLRRTMGASEIGDTDYYIPVSQGRALESGFVQALTYTAAANRPYSPVHGVLTLSGGDWSITATRRTRIGGANVDGQDVPLGEASQSWEADIMDGSTVVRTLTGTSLPLTYTAAQQTTDWGSGQSTLTVNLYQMNPTLALRGYPLALAA